MTPLTEVTLTQSSRELLRDALERARPREACGVLAGDVAYELPNRSEGRGTFHIYAEDLAPIAERHAGWDGITAIWHTHPEGETRPSPDDVEYHPMGKIMVIVTPDDFYFYAHAAEA